jgi:hypothetical protein
VRLEADSWVADTQLLLWVAQLGVSLLLYSPNGRAVTVPHNAPEVAPAYVYVSNRGWLEPHIRRASSMGSERLLPPS